MRMIFTTGGFEYGGAQRVMCNLANSFLEDNNEVILLTFAYTGNANYYIDPRVKWINGIGWKNAVDGIRKLRKIILAEQPDIVISFVTQYNVASCIALLGTSIPLIISERNDPVQVPPQKSKRFLRWLFYRFSDGFVFQTKQARDFFSPKIVKRSVVIANPLFLNEHAPEVSNRDQHIMAAARFVPQKNHKMLMEAFTLIADQNPGWTLEIFGDGEESEISKARNYVASQSMEERIHIRPAMQAIHQEMGKNAIFALTSDYEGMPNSLMEAMGMGMACISTNCPCGGPEYLIQDGKDGILVPVGSVEKLKDALERLILNPEYREEIGKNALKIRDRLKLETIAGEWKSYVNLFYGYKEKRHVRSQPSGGQ